MTSTVLTTDRLYSGDWRDLTSGELAALFAAPVIEYLPTGFHARTTEAEQRAFLTLLSQQAEVLALYDQQNSGVGMLVLSGAVDDEIERHLGYLFAQEFWGQGLASELIAGLQDLFLQTGTTLIGRVMQGNAVSAHVLLKAGFQAEESGEETVYSWSGPTNAGGV